MGAREGRGNAGQRTVARRDARASMGADIKNIIKRHGGGKASWHVLAMRKQGTGLVLNVAEASAKRRSAHARPIRGRAKWRQRPIKGPRQGGGSGLSRAAPRRARSAEAAATEGRAKRT